MEAHYFPALQQSAFLTLKTATFTRKNENWKPKILPQCCATESMLVYNI